ncbi:MAG: hypothetical protein OJF49_001735 [Ktedonobacterales bacterium]|nr:MAG: hypothetical protein OJF49_001735 [Ktedonobacterales bacterium]
MIAAINGRWDSGERAVETAPEWRTAAKPACAGLGQRQDG